jgi:hypothetical protein
MTPSDFITKETYKSPDVDSTVAVTDSLAVQVRRRRFVRFMSANVTRCPRLV